MVHMIRKYINGRKCPTVVAPDLVGLAPRHAEHLVVPINIFFYINKTELINDQNARLCTYNALESVLK